MNSYLERVDSPRAYFCFCLSFEAWYKGLNEGGWITLLATLYQELLKNEWYKLK